MKSNWCKIKIGDIGEVFTGHTPPKKNKEYFGGPYPWIKPTDIVIGSRYVEKIEETYSELAYEKYKKYLLPPLSTCVVTIGTVGNKICLTKEPSFTNQSINAIIPNQEYDSMFIFYLMKYNLPVVAKRNPGTASGRHHVSKSNFMSIELEIPPLNIQQKISRILSSYDDLIEVNLKRIRVLEDLARSLYDEWFVRLQFPGHEDTEITQTEYGPTPKGWKISKIIDFTQVFRGKSYRSSNLVDENGIPFITLKFIDRDGGFRISGLKQFIGDYKEKHSAQVGDVFIALTDMTQERRVIGRAARAPNIGVEKFVYSMDLLKLIPLNDFDNDFLYGLCRYSKMPLELKEFANGVNVLHLAQKHVKNYEFILTAIELRKEYSEIMSPIYKQIDVLTRKNITLKITMELLLPKLISGEIDISDIDIAV